MALGAASQAAHANSTAIGAGAATTRDNQVMLGTKADDITAPSLAGSGTEMIYANGDGTLRRSSVSVDQIDDAVNKRIPKLESAARGLGQAVQSAGAIAAAMSAIPEVTLQEDEPIRCGVGTGGYGSQYALSAGCAVRVGDRLHLNGALSYSPSVDYEFGSTPSVAGRLGFSFPLGRIAKASQPSQAAISEMAEYRTMVDQNITKLQGDVKSREQEIEQLKQRLETLLQNDRDQARSGVGRAGREANGELVAMLRQRIDQLEKQKQEADQEDQRQNALIEDLSQRDTASREQINVLEQKLEASDQRVNGLQQKLDAVLKRLGLLQGDSSRR